MRIHNVHSRELVRWPTTPIELDRPLGPGPRGGSPAPRPPLPRLLRVADAVEGGLIRLRRNPLVSA
jgi:hypothetical protein